MNQLFKARLNSKLLKDTMVKNRNFLVIITVLLCLTFPIPLLLELYYSGSMDTRYMDTDAVAFLFLATAGLLMFTPFLFFNYLTKKRSVDFMHSLPISRSSLFLTYATASILIVLIPFTLTYWLGHSISYIFYQNSFEWFHIVIFIRAVLLFGAIQVPTIFVIMNTGTLSDSVIFTMILFAAPMIAYFAISSFYSLYLLGFSNLSSTNILLYISPITLFLSSLIKVGGPENINLLTLYWVIGSGILYVLSCSAYRNWKSEYSERPFNNDYFYPFVISLFTALLFMMLISVFSIDYNASLKFLSPVNLVFPVLITYVIYVVIDFIKHRTTKFYFKATKHFALIIIFSLSITTIIYSTQGFGYAWRIPDLEDIESVHLGTQQYFNEYSEIEVLITNKEDIESITEVHQHLVDQFKEANSFFSSDIELGNYTATLDIQYNLGGKSKLKRNFAIPQELMDTLLEFESIKGVVEQNQPLLKKQDVRNLSFYEISSNTELLMDDVKLELFIDAYLSDLTSIENTIEIMDESRVKYLIKYSAETKDFYSGESKDYDREYQLIVDERFSRTLDVLANADNIETSYSTYILPNEFIAYNEPKHHFYTPSYYSLDVESAELVSNLEAEQFIDKIYLSSKTNYISQFLLIINESDGEIAYVLPVYN